MATGVGPYFDGIAHAFLSFEDAMAMAGGLGRPGRPQRQVSRARRGYRLPLAWFAGCIFGMRIGVVSIQPWLSIVSFLGLGIAIAAKLRLNPTVIASLTLLVAFAFGFAASFDLSAVSSLALFVLGSLTANGDGHDSHLGNRSLPDVAGA